jgi:transcription elongation factor Elf1
MKKQVAMRPFHCPKCNESPKSIWICNEGGAGCRIISEEPYFEWNGKSMSGSYRCFTCGSELERPEEYFDDTRDDFRLAGSGPVAWCTECGQKYDDFEFYSGIYFSFIVDTKADGYSVRPESALFGFDFLDDPKKFSCPSCKKAGSIKLLRQLIYSVQEFSMTRDS